MRECTMPTKTQSQTPDTREESRTLTPAVDIFETPDALVVIADLPGVAKDAVDVRVEDNILTLKGTPKGDNRDDMLSREFELHEFNRQFTLGEQIDQDKIGADMKHGVLTVRLPKTEKVKPKQIEVKIAS